MATTIDILMATYQGAAFLEAQINSILEQSYTDWRLLIGDDGSSDDTLKIISTFIEKDPRITLIPKKSNETTPLGAIGNFSRLMSEATAPYIMFCDQDDVWFSDKIEKTLEQMHALEKQYGQSKPLLIHTDLYVVDEDLDPISPSLWRYASLLSRRYLSLNRLLAQNVVTGCTMMLNRPLLDLAQPIPVGVCMHDWWIALVAVAFGHMGCVQEPTMDYRQHGQNSVGAKPYGFWSGIKKLLKERKSTKPKIRDNRSIQAKLFLERYRDRLDPTKREMLEAFEIYCHGSPFEKWKVMRKYGFYKSGWLRNMHEIFS